MTNKLRQLYHGLLIVPCLACAKEEVPETPATPPPAEAPRWEGAVGLRASYGPTYQGAADRRARLAPGFFLRYGRFTVTNSSGFVTRRADDVVRGLGIDLARDSRLRVNLALRFDQGRGEGSDPALKGLGDVKQTVRARLNLAYALGDGWRLGGSWAVDALGRGGGFLGDVGFGHERRLTPDTVWTWGAGLGFAGDRYMQSWYGVNEEQSARSGYPVYQPGSGLRDMSLFTSFRTELSDRWLLIGGAAANRLVGPAADSPLVKNRNGWSVNAGLAWRF